MTFTMITMNWTPYNVYVIITCLPIYVTAYCSTDFHGDSKYPFKKYQLVTAYDQSERGNISDYQLPSGCTHLGMVFITRHGSRYRPADDEEGKFDLLESLRDKLNTTGNATMCFSDLNKIKLWENWYHPSLESDLSPLGYQEMMGLGQRFKQAFPELFSDSSSFKFHSSDTQRTQESARMFMSHAYNSTQDIIVDDPLIRPYDYCDKYRVEVTENEETLAEKEEFGNGRVFADMASIVSKRLGVLDGDIDIDTIGIMQQEGCAEEEIANGTDSPWCLAFTKEDLQAFEYRDDMGDYNRFGFGNHLSYKTSCPTKRFILSALKNISDGESVNQFLFAHGFGFLRILADMNMIEDDGPFLVEDYPVKVNRTYRASLYSPMSGSLAFVVNQCGAEKKLQVFHKEKPLYLPLHSPITNGTWDLDEALDYFGFNDPEDCNWTDLCSLRSEVTDASTSDETTSAPTSDETTSAPTSDETTSAGYSVNQLKRHAIFILLNLVVLVSLDRVQM